MAKNRNQQQQRPSQQSSGYDKFKPGAMLPPGDPRMSGVETIPAPVPTPDLPPNEDDDENEIQEATDPLPVDPITEEPAADDKPLKRQDAIVKADGAKTMAEQEAIIASIRPGKPNSELPDPAAMYNRVLARGDGIIPLNPNADADPLLIACHGIMERIAAGNLLLPQAYQCRNELISVLTKVKERLTEKPADAQPDQGCADGADREPVGVGAGGSSVVDAVAAS